mmetsp:Transcript_1667/g.5403  ORF Transcript_1667/g.5403 Transcript_1667/m.5403 type:complete len:459 (-) Transcript_1667:109-1485(-)
MRRARREDAVLGVARAPRRRDFSAPARVHVHVGDDPAVVEAREAAERAREVRSELDRAHEAAAAGRLAAHRGLARRAEALRVGRPHDADGLERDGRRRRDARRVVERRPLPQVLPPRRRRELAAGRGVVGAALRALRGPDAAVPEPRLEGLDGVGRGGFEGRVDGLVRVVGDEVDQDARAPARRARAGGLDRLDEGRDGVGVARPVVDARDEHDLEDGLAPLLRPRLQRADQPVAELRGRVLRRRHERPSQLLVGAVERPGDGRRVGVAEELGEDARRRAHRRHGHAVPAVGEARAVDERRHGVAHGPDVVAGLAHAHEHDVPRHRQPRGPRRGRREGDLREDLDAAQAPREAHLARGAEGAGLAAADLRRHADRRLGARVLRGAARRRDDDGLDVRAVGEAHEQLERAVGRAHRLLDGGDVRGYSSRSRHVALAQGLPRRARLGAARRREQRVRCHW